MPFLGCIADDFTGGTDLSSNLVKGGFRTIQTLGLGVDLPDACDAVVVALKSRTIAADEAQKLSLQALQWLRALGCQQFYFKYCSTFDSTPAGNIGPVIDVLLDALEEPFTIVCPAFPDNGRTVYRGHLFVHDQLLNESGMQNHPLTPMTDADVVRILSAQTPSKVGLIRCDAIAKGADAIRQQFVEMRSRGIRMAVMDTISNHDLQVLAQATAHLKLVTGGSGLARYLHPDAAVSPQWSPSLSIPAGSRAILAGSCSKATLAQIEYAKRLFPSFKLHPADLQRDFDAAIEGAVIWARPHLNHVKPVLIYSSGDPTEVTAAQLQFGFKQTGEWVEKALATIAVRLVDGGVRQFIVAGGETSGAVVNALKIRSLRIGREIVPGVPWTVGLGGPHAVALALKSGNFGGADFLAAAWAALKEN